ncbi:hypothetical protein TcG_01349 [Trypanosoma cruzi]|nr:hypothetical protein TcG_01349 [Trypanosoma cruzi]
MEVKEDERLGVRCLQIDILTLPRIRKFKRNLKVKYAQTLFRYPLVVVVAPRFFFFFFSASATFAESERGSVSVRALFGEYALFLQLPPPDALITRLNFLLILRRHVIRITANAVSWVGGVHFAQRPVSPLQEAFICRNAILYFSLLFKALRSDDAFNKRIFWSPTDTLPLLFHLMLPGLPTRLKIKKRTQNKLT